jgi:hypothetical protein
MLSRCLNWTRNIQSGVPEYSKVDISLRLKRRKRQRQNFFYLQVEAAMSKS